MTDLTTEQIQQRLRGMQQSFNDAEQGGYSDPLAGIPDDDYQTRLESFDVFSGKKNPDAIYLKTFFSIQHDPDHSGRELTTFHDLTDPDKLGFVKDHFHALGVDVENLDLGDIYPGSDLLRALLDKPCLVGVYTNKKGYRNVVVRQRLDGEGVQSDLGTGQQQIADFDDPKPKAKPKGRSQGQQAADVERQLAKPEGCTCPDPTTGQFDSDCKVPGHGIGW